MKKIYFSAVISISENVSPVLGVEMEVDVKDGFTYEEQKKNFRFIVNRYFGDVTIKAFGRITKKDFDECTNIKISAL